MTTMLKDLLRFNCLFFIVFLLPCVISAQPAVSPVIHTLFLVGDAGESYIGKEPFGKVLRRFVGATGNSATVIYLGDNVYPAGLSYPASRSRATDEKILQMQVDWVKGLNAKCIFIPGNHDWAHWGKEGLKYILHQQQWVDSLHDKNFFFLPRQGCPGPIEVQVNDKLVLVMLDTQWFLHRYDKPGEDGPCDAKTPNAAMAQLNDLLLRHQGKRIIMAGHHPVITYGQHGGVFTWKDHLFPLTGFGHKSIFYIPLPVVGSLYVLSRKLFPSIQDTSHPDYKVFSGTIHELLKKHSGSVYVAGHEHALQYIVKDKVHYIVSGSGAKVSSVRKKQYAEFTAGKRGFAQLQVHGNGKITINFIRVDDHMPDGRQIFTTLIDSVPGPEKNK